MRNLFSAQKSVVARLRAGLAIGTLLGAAALAGCQNATEAVPDPGRGYYPLAVGNTWTYAVRDSVWSVATVATPTSRATATSFQFRETISEVFTDAAARCNAGSMALSGKPLPSGSFEIWLNSATQLNPSHRRTSKVNVPGKAPICQ